MPRKEGGFGTNCFLDYALGTRTEGVLSISPGADELHPGALAHCRNEWLWLNTSFYIQYNKCSACMHVHLSSRFRIN